MNRKIPTGFRVERRQQTDIRASAQAVRDVLKIGMDRFDAEQLIDLLGVHFGITVDITEDNELLQGSEAFCDPSRAEIYLSETTHKQIASGHPRGLFTLAHELGHLVFIHQRHPQRTAASGHKWIEDSEWQANTFASEFLMPLKTIIEQRLFNEECLAEYFGVSKEAAKIRLTKLRSKNEI